MQLTTQFEFTQGYGQFPPERTYILIGHVKTKNKVAIAHLRKVNTVDLIFLSREAFEKAIDDGIIKALDQQALLPPWVCYTETASQRSAQALQIKHCVRINNHMRLIKQIYLLWTSMLNSTEPVRAINQAIRAEAKLQGLNINLTRVRAQFLTYIAFGQNEAALLPGYPNCGSTAKANTLADGSIFKKRGRPARNGKNSGFNVDAQMLEMMCAGYLKHKKLCFTVKRCYIRTLDTEFGCKTVCDNKQCIIMIYQPDNQPFPSESQFRFHIKKIFGEKKVREAVVGTNRVRRAESASEGAYSDGIAYVGESVQFDGKVSNEYPISFNGSAVLDKMHTVSMRDVASGMVLGIGGGIGAEDATSHKLMLFCAAIDKVKFCSLFGVEIAPHMWPSNGIPEGLLGDRGPGISADFVNQSEATLRSFGRSFHGQDKPNIETSHKKTIKIEGRQPIQYAKSNPVELFKNQIAACITNNCSINLSSRMTPEMVAQGVAPNAFGIFDFLSGKGRSMLVQIPFEKAVRDYLTPITVKITSDGVMYNGLRFRSAELMQSGLPDYAKRNGSFEIKAFNAGLQPCLMTSCGHRTPVMERIDFIPARTSTAKGYRPTAMVSCAS